MLCSPMMIPHHPPRRLDPPTPLGQSRFGKDFPESCVNQPGSGTEKKCHAAGGGTIGLGCRKLQDSLSKQDLTGT